jgi:ATP-dependent Clp protease ATP-binding subunit ClpC
MFEGYTEKTQRIIFFARYEAAQVGASSIEPEHLLLGLLRESRELITPPVDLDNLIHELRAAMPPGREKISTSVDLPLSHGAKRVLAYSAEEAKRLNHEKIAPAHLLLGILRESGRPAELLLGKHGVSLTPLREKISKHGISAKDTREEPNSRSGNGAIVYALRETFSPMASRLTGEIEPAVTFGLKSGDAA